MATVVKYLNIPKDERETYKGWHLTDPISTDNTLCGVAIGDNYDRLGTDSKEGKPTCERCKVIVNFCKKI